MKYETMTDFDLCCKKTIKSKEVLWHRYKRYIYKQSRKSYRILNQQIDLDDIIQDYNLKFFEGLNKFDKTRINDIEDFKLLKYMYPLFRTVQRNFKYFYRDDLKDNCANYIHNQTEFYLDYQLKELEDLHTGFEDLFLFNYLEKKLSKKEYNIIYRIFILKEPKASVGKTYKMSSNLFSFHYNKLLKKIESFLLAEKKYLLS